MTFLELTEGQISEKDTSLMQMLRCLLYGKHLPNTSNNSFKMLPVLGKFTDLKLPKINKNLSKNPFLEQNVSSLRQMLAPIIMGEHLPTTTDKFILPKFCSIFKNDSTFR